MVAIVDTAGVKVVEYLYDAWGKLLTTSGSMASTLGVHNPLRYRGYVYDTDTELYYLQSRYYDPKMGRFLNADVLISTGAGLLCNNMFAYCKNNPVNYYDSEGTDAIWIQEGESAMGMGHTGLLIEDPQGDWWYFYWGPKDPNAFFPFMCVNVPEVCIYQKVETDGYDLTTADGVQEMLSANKISPYPDSEPGEITDVKYYEGNYVRTHLYLWSYSENCEGIFGPNYSLLMNNCVQVCVRALGKSDFRFAFYASLIPNFAYSDVEKSGPQALQ